jgi:hypothetical protein
MDATNEQVAERQNPDVSHERSDVSIAAILIFAVALLVSAVIIHLLIWWLLGHFAARAARSGRPLPAMTAHTTGEPVPPEPRLQVSPAQELQEMRAAEDAILNTYGWADQQAGVVRIPIDRALQILAQRGLPLQPQAENKEARKQGNGATEQREN